MNSLTELLSLSEFATDEIVTGTQLISFNAMSVRTTENCNVNIRLVSTYLRDIAFMFLYCLKEIRQFSKNKEY